jgi:hypothetical protein
MTAMAKHTGDGAGETPKLMARVLEPASSARPALRWRERIDRRGRGDYGIEYVAVGAAWAWTPQSEPYSRRHMT